VAETPEKSLVGKSIKKDIRLTIEHPLRL
jgi:hypothetical protein